MKCHQHFQKGDCEDAGDEDDGVVCGEVSHRDGLWWTVSELEELSKKEGHTWVRKASIRMPEHTHTKRAVMLSYHPRQGSERYRDGRRIVKDTQKVRSERLEQ